MGKSKLTGAWGEALAAEYLRKKRYTVVASGYRCRFGEIDLIVKNREDMYVERLAERLGLTPPTVSFHLKKLADGAPRHKRRQEIAGDGFAPSVPCCARQRYSPS